MSVHHGKDRDKEAKADALLAPQAPDPLAIEFATFEALTMQGAWKETTQRSFAKFAAAGRLYAQQKDALPHGEWLPWLHRNIPQSYRDREKKHAAEAWERTVRNWMRVAVILDHCHPETLEAAQTVAQLFRLAQFLPEGQPAPGETSGEPEPAEIVSRLKRWVASNAALLSVERVRSLPVEIRAELREQLAPFAAILAELAA